MSAPETETERPTRLPHCIVCDDRGCEHCPAVEPEVEREEAA